jgi:hypothetical protein
MLCGPIRVIHIIIVPTVLCVILYTLFSFLFVFIRRKHGGFPESTHHYIIRHHPPPLICSSLNYLKELLDRHRDIVRRHRAFFTAVPQLFPYYETAANCTPAPIVTRAELNQLERERLGSAQYNHSNKRPLWNRKRKERRHWWRRERWH